MATEVREQQREFITVSVVQYFIITISGNAADGFIQSSLVLRFPVTVDKDEIRIPINRDRAADPRILLILFFK